MSVDNGEFLNSLEVNKKDQSAVPMGLGRLTPRPCTKYHHRVNLASIFGTQRTQTGHTQVALMLSLTITQQVIEMNEFMNSEHITSR